MGLGSAYARQHKAHQPFQPFQPFWVWEAVLAGQTTLRRPTKLLWQQPGEPLDPKWLKQLKWLMGLGSAYARQPKVRQPFQPFQPFWDWEAVLAGQTTSGDLPHPPWIRRALCRSGPLGSFGAAWTDWRRP